MCNVQHIVVLFPDYLLLTVFFQAENIAGATLDYNRKSMLKEFLLKYFPSGTFNLHICSTLHATA